MLIAVAFMAASCELPGSHPACNAQIEWINFIEVGSTQYVAGPSSSTILNETDLGTVYSHVRFKVSGSVCEPNYRVKDGDAAFLEPGTPIYQVKGSVPAKELAARFNGQIVLYRAIAP